MHNAQIDLKLHFRDLNTAAASESFAPDRGSQLFPPFLPPQLIAKCTAFSWSVLSEPAAAISLYFSIVSFQKVCDVRNASFFSLATFAKNVLFGGVLSSPRRLQAKLGSIICERRLLSLYKAKMLCTTRIQLVISANLAATFKSQSWKKSQTSAVGEKLSNFGFISESR
jgi:hypothetical protein